MHYKILHVVQIVQFVHFVQLVHVFHIVTCAESYRDMRAERGAPAALRTASSASMIFADV